MRRFFTEKADKPEMIMCGAEHKHLTEVLRAKSGDAVIICPNDGTDYIYEVKSIDKKSTTLIFLREERNNAETEIDLTVFFALLKGDKSELVVTKLTELGVKCIVPFVSEFTVKIGDKTDRLKRAATEACKQCGRSVLPAISDVIDFPDIIPLMKDFDKVVFAYEGAYVSGSRIKDVISGNEKRVALIVGAEGGFSEKEVQTLNSHGVPAVTLGKRILRAETAAIAAASVLLYICGEWE